MSDSLQPHESQQPGFPVHHQLPEFSQTHMSFGSLTQAWLGLGHSLQDSVTLAKMGDARDSGPGPSRGVSIHRAHSSGLSGAGRVASSHQLGPWPTPLLFDTALGRSRCFRGALRKLCTIRGGRTRFESSILSPLLARCFIHL